MELPTGTIVDSAYRISAPVRLAKDGDIYLGEPIAPGPPVLIHILRTALMEGDPGLEVFERAGLELCRFSHDAFPEVVDFGRFMVRPYIVTEKIEGRLLSDIVGSGEIGTERALKIINSTRDALTVAHKAGMAHGPLTTANVMLTEDGEVKLVDLFTRWITQQINTRGKEIDTSADLQSLVEISQVLIKDAKRTAPPAPITSDLDLPRAKWTLETKPPKVSTPENKLTVQRDLDAPPPPAPKLWEEFTPEPEVISAPSTMVMVVPEEIRARAKIVAASVPKTGKPAMKVRLPPPPISVRKEARAVLPTPSVPPPRRAAPPPLPVQRPAPVARVPLPRIASFAPTGAALEVDDTFLGNELQPGYVEFFRNLLPRAGLERGEKLAENSASRSFNLLVTCAVALVMLAAVLNF
jgi:hypothetical protein